MPPSSLTHFNLLFIVFTWLHGAEEKVAAAVAVSADARRLDILDGYVCDGDSWLDFSSVHKKKEKFV